ncbi:MAG TPA: hypothetical protein VGF32_24625 [Streptosporangiaceae bacterium]
MSMTYARGDRECRAWHPDELAAFPSAAVVRQIFGSPCPGCGCYHPCDGCGNYHCGCADGKTCVASAGVGP